MADFLISFKPNQQGVVEELPLTGVDYEAMKGQPTKKFISDFLQTKGIDPKNVQDIAIDPSSYKDYKDELRWARKALSDYTTENWQEAGAHDASAALLSTVGRRSPRIAAMESSVRELEKIIAEQERKAKPETIGQRFKDLGASVGKGAAKGLSMASYLVGDVRPLSEKMESAELVTPVVSQDPRRKVERFIAESVGASAALPIPGAGGLGVRSLYGGISGAGQYLGGEVGGPVGEVVGAFAAPTLAGGVERLLPSAQRLANRAGRGLGTADYQEAAALQNIARQEGISMPSNQALGAAPGHRGEAVADLAADVFRDPRFREQAIAGHAKLPGEVETALQRYLRRFEQMQGISSQRGTEALQEAVTAAQGWTQAQRKAATTAYTQALPKGTTAQMNRSTITDFVKELKDQANSIQFGPESEGGKLLMSLANKVEGQFRHLKGSRVSTARLDVLRKDLDTTAEAIARMQGGGNVPYDKQAHAFFSRRVKELTPGLDDARSAYSRVMEAAKGRQSEFLGGLERSVSKTGKVSDASLNSLFKSPRDMSGEIYKLADNIGTEKMTGLWVDFLKREVQRGFQPGDIQTKMQQPASLAQTLYGDLSRPGNAAQKNTNAMLNIISRQHGVDGIELRKGFKGLVKVLDSFRNVKIPPSERGMAQAEASRNALSTIFAPSYSVRRFMDMTTSGAKYSDLMGHFLNTKEGIQGLQKIANTSSSTQRQLVVIQTMLALDRQQRAAEEGAQ